jgi:hypothetical protein
MWWSKYVKTGEGSFIAMVKTLAHVLGLDLSDKLENNKKHKTPFSKTAEFQTFRTWAREQDISYLKLANYSRIQRRLIADIQWGARPIGTLFVDGSNEFEFLRSKAASRGWGL